MTSARMEINWSQVVATLAATTEYRLIKRSDEDAGKMRFRDISRSLFIVTIASRALSISQTLNS